MRIVYKRSLGFISFLIFICLFIGVAYLFYDKVINNETEVVVVDNLSINYLNGRKITSDGTYKFSITNSGQQDISYDILINELSGYDDKFVYSLNSSEANINITNVNLEEDNFTIGEALLIKANETQNFVLTINNNTKTSFKLKVNVNDEVIEYFYATLLKNNKVRNKTVTKVAEDIATTNEGLIEDVDDYGATYYFRGISDNNYVSFAGLTWRIVRINGDGTVRLVLNEVASELANYHEKTENYEILKDTSINKKLLDYYETYLKNHDDYISKSKFCEEPEYIKNEDEKIYNAYSRVYTNKIPTFNCLGNKYTAKIGLLTIDEVAYAGANFRDNNKDYYLSNDKIEEVWWTSNISKANKDNFYPFIITENGKIDDNVSGMLYRNLRPVINLNKKVIVSGSGTIDEPYTINE
ncbi:MAG: hypothetical protein E7163_01535 [Firmicutes bacterium]|nr:hypothetical protein [Bacillota bacterium]